MSAVAIDLAFEFDCPKHRNFAVLDDELVSDSWFDEQRLKYVPPTIDIKGKAVPAKDVPSKARKSIHGVANKENAAANAPSRRASVSDVKRKSIKNKQQDKPQERAPLTSRPSTKPAAQPITSRPSIKPRPSVSSQKSAAAALSKPRVSVSVSVSATARSNAPSRLLTRPSITAPPPMSRPSTAQRMSTQPQHRRSISTPVQTPKQQTPQVVSHQRSRSSVQSQPVVNQPPVRLSTRPSVAVVAPSAVATTVRSTAPLTRPTAINFATDNRALERAAKEKKRTSVQPKSASAPSTSRVSANIVPNTTSSLQARQRTTTRCEPFKLSSTNDRKRKPAPASATPATPARVNQLTKRPRPVTAVQPQTARTTAPTPMKTQPVPRPITSPSPFALRSIVRHEAYQARLAEQHEAERLAEMEAMNFRAPPLDAVRHVLTASPFVPKLDHCHTEPDNVFFKSEARASARRAWEDIQRVNEEEQSEIERKRHQERTRIAAAELAALRHSLIHHPLPVRNFEHVFHPHPSSQPLTEARSPCLLTKSRALSHNADTKA